VADELSGGVPANGTPPAELPPPPSRPARADARRNYDKLVAAAQAAFARDGAEASLDGIAKAAGVGPGTLYRHFPHRLALVEAVYAEKVTELCARAEEFATTLEPFDAVLAWGHEMGRHAVTYAVLKELMAGDTLGGGPDMSYCRAAMRGATARVVHRAQAAGELRDDVRPLDVLRMIHGMALAAESVPVAERAEQSRRLIDLALSGLRTSGATAPAP
jgi:AcrR family transcriptional regulator